MLALALEKLSQQSIANDLDVRIFLDVSSKEKLDETEYVRDTYFPTATIFQAKEHVAAPSGCWNILHAIKSGYETGAEFIFLIEEDVIIYPDYFEWHFAVHNNENSELLATCGRRKKEYKSLFYTNPGSCLNRKLLDKIVPHINDDFFADRIDYLNTRFDVMDDASDLDDGLVRRVVKKEGALVIYPDSAVCAHQGFWAYQKLIPYKVYGGIQERIEQLRALLPTLDPRERYLKDFEPYKWTKQRVPHERIGETA